MEFLPGASAGLADPDGGVYDVHPGPGVVTISALLQMAPAPGPPVTTAARQTSPPPVIRDLAKKEVLKSSIYLYFLFVKRGR